MLIIILCFASCLFLNELHPTLLETTLCVPAPLPPQMHTHAVVSIEGLRAGRVWTAVTSAFSHQQFMHLAANMIGLYFFGRDMGRRFGGKRVRAMRLCCCRLPVAAIMWQQPHYGCCH